MNLKSLLLACASAVALLVPAASVLAQDYPAKPVKLVSPYAPGGSTGVVARLLAKKFGDQTGGSMIVENKPGAASNIGSDMVAKSPPDGYTLLMGTSSLAINPTLYKSMSFDPLKDLAPVTALISSPNVLAVDASLPIRSVKELIDYARANPGKLNYGSSGNGATNHMAMEMLKTMAGVQLTHVPFKGGGEALAALLGGQIQVMFNPASTLQQHHNSGRIRMLAVTSEKRMEGLALPAVSETLPGFESSVWFALFAPAGTPAPIIQKLSAETNKALADKESLALLKEHGMLPLGGTPEQLRALLLKDTARWAPIVKASGAKVD
ncbi:Bug family tripartite tricarboxylate transporter substrate binding protein [Ramlibacter sp.]|uniref:Bug family tripartite tricarboxylate transporter substrate binding protein n=1 Tax=Ramlibacter sp. TaxID=1917967 RepID=UPI003D130F89